MACPGASRCVIRDLAIGLPTKIRDFLAYRWVSAYASELERAMPMVINDV